LSDFTIEVQKGTAAAFLDRLRTRRVLGGFALADPRPGRSTSAGELIRVGVTESTDARTIEKYAKEAAAVMAAAGAKA
jgi:hypothetical protein